MLTRRVAELEEKWLKSASHLENLREQTKRKEQDYLASMARFEEHEKLVLRLEAEYREAKNLLVTPVPSDHSDVGVPVKRKKVMEAWSVTWRFKMLKTLMSSMIWT